MCTHHQSLCKCSYISPFLYLFFCSAFQPFCGDGIKNGNEVCDEGPANSDDPDAACRTDCKPKRCGDGVLDGGEVCDNGDLNSNSVADSCREDCKLPRCGDMVTDNGEECDDGIDTATCRGCVTAFCGDGTQDVGEQCDDGNIIDNDGCSANCKTEVGKLHLFLVEFMSCFCSPLDTLCVFQATPQCGDGNLDAGEQCDDNNTDDGDGCSSNCLLESCYNKNKGDLCDADGNGEMDGCCSSPGSTGLCGSTILSSPFDTDDDGAFDECCACAAAVNGAPPSFQVDGIQTESIQENYECDGGLPPYPTSLTTFDCQGSDLEITRIDGVDPDPKDLTCSSVVTRQWSASSCGQMKNFTQTITIQDSTAPVADLQDRSYECFSSVPEGSGDIVTADDACSGEVVGIWKSDTFPQKCVFSRTWTFTDNCNLKTVGTISIEITDSDPPTITKPNDYGTQCLVDVEKADASVTDNCAATLTGPSETFEKLSNTQPTECTDRTITRNWTAIDECGNEATEMQTITVEDTNAPTLPSDSPSSCGECG